MIQFSRPGNPGRERRYNLKNFLKTVDQKILNPETRLKGITYLYMVFAGLLLLHHIYVIIYHKEVLNGATVFFVPFVILIVVNFFLGKLWKDKLFYVFLALLVLKIVRTAMIEEYAVEVSTEYFVLSAYAYFGCYGIARVIPRDKWKVFLSILCFLWTIAAVVFASFGLKAAFTGEPIANLGTEAFIVKNDHRLYLLHHPVSSGVILSTCMSFAVFGCFLTKTKILKPFYIAAALVLFLTASLTGTRTAYILSGASLGLLLYIPLRDLLKPGVPKSLIKTGGKYAVLFLTVIITAALVAWLQSKTINLLHYIQLRGGLVISNAYAENETALAAVQERGFDYTGSVDVLFTGRLTIWQNALDVVFSNLENALLGVSVYNTMIPVWEIRLSKGLFYVYHCHNTFVQHLLENGIPALLLYCSIVFTVIYHAIRVLKNRNLPFWQRMLPITALVCLLEGLGDNTCHVNFGYPQMTLLYLFAGFSTTLSQKEKGDSTNLNR